MYYCFTKITIILFGRRIFANKSPSNTTTNGQAGLAILISPLSSGINDIMHQVAEQLLATLDKVGFKAALNLGNLVIVLVADKTKRDSHPRFA